MLKANSYADQPSYGLAVDMWSCGVVFYTLISGSAPFYHRKTVYMLRDIMNGKYSFPSSEWQNISTSCKQLVSHLTLTCDITTRVLPACYLHTSRHLCIQFLFQPSICSPLRCFSNSNLLSVLDLSALCVGVICSLCWSYLLPTLELSALCVGVICTVWLLIGFLSMNWNGWRLLMVMLLLLHS